MRYVIYEKSEKCRKIENLNNGSVLCVCAMPITTFPCMENNLFTALFTCEPLEK